MTRAAFSIGHSLARKSRVDCAAAPGLPTARISSGVLRQVEHPLGDDVALDLGGAGVDGAGARPEELARPVDVGPRARRCAQQLRRPARAGRARSRGSACRTRSRRSSRSTTPAPGVLPSAKLASVRRPLARMTSFSTSSRASFSRTAAFVAPVLAAGRGQHREVAAEARRSSRAHTAPRSYASTVIAIRQPSPIWPTRFSRGTRASSKNTSPNSLSPVICRRRRTVTPGVSSLQRMNEMPP